MRRVLNPSGWLLIVWQPRWAKTEQAVKDIAHQTSEQLSNIGFKLKELKFKPLKSIIAICALALKSALHYTTNSPSEALANG